MGSYARVMDVLTVYQIHTGRRRARKCQLGRAASEGIREQAIQRVRIGESTYGQAIVL